MGNPVDEYLKSCAPVEKKAGLMDTVRGSFGRAFSGPELGTLAWQTAAVGGVSALVGAARKAYDAATKSTDFKSMLDVNPDLVESHAENPKMFNQYYSSLRNLSPAFAADPVVAGSYMRQMTEHPYNAGNVLVNSVGASPKLPPSRLRDYAGGLDIAQRAGHAPVSEKDRLQAEKYQMEINALYDRARGGRGDEE